MYCTPSTCVWWCVWWCTAMPFLPPVHPSEPSAPLALSVPADCQYWSCRLQHGRDTEHSKVCLCTYASCRVLYISWTKSYRTDISCNQLTDSATSVSTCTFAQCQSAFALYTPTSCVRTWALSLTDPLCITYCMCPDFPTCVQYMYGL